MSRPFAVTAALLISVSWQVLLMGCGSSSGIHSFQLTVATPPAGAGAVTSSPAGINCPTACSATFAQNTQVTLTATPGANFLFGGWSGACSGNGTCIVEMRGAESVTANFASNAGGGGADALFVYVSSMFDGGGSEIVGFSASSDGQLTSLAGSPFPFSIGGLAASGKFLFGTDGTNIYTYAIGKDGSIVQSSSLDARQYNNPVDCSGGPQFLFIDRTGSNLYDLDDRSDCANNSYQSFSLDSAGALTFLADTTDTSPVFERGLQFTGNDEFGFSASCYHFNQEIFGFKRNADGSLALETSLGMPPLLPSGPDGEPYCPWLAASDGANHLAVSLTPINGSTFEQAGPPQLALYMVDDAGNLATISTSSNMPQVAGDTVNDLEISPSGKFLAVGESSGLEVFNFDGENPITAFTGLLTNDAIDEVRWDGADHLYAISNSGGKLYVFSVNASGALAVSGSPYPVSSPTDLVVSSGS